MATKTWNVDRKKGGTYSFKLDAQGNYGLHKDGFEGVKTLNLPELQKEKTTTTTTTQDTKTASAQTQKAFGDVQPFYYDKKSGEGDQYTSEYQMQKGGDLATDQAMTKGDNFAQARQSMTSDAAYSGVTPSDRQPGFEVANKGITKQGIDKRGYENIGKVDTTPAHEKQLGRANVDKVLAERAQANKFGTGQQWGAKPSKGMPTTRVPDRISSPLRPSIEKPTLTKTALKAVNIASNTLAKAVGFAVTKNPIGLAITGLNKVSGKLRGINPTTGKVNTQAQYEQQRSERQQQNRTDNMIDRISKGKSTRSNPRDAGTTKAQKDAISEAIHEKARSQQGGGGNSGGKRVICTYFYSKNQFSLIDLQLDTEFSRNNLSDEVKIGYWFWAIPLVDWMKKYENSNNWWVKLVRNSTKLFAQERAKEIAYIMGKKNKGSLIGKFVRLFGETGCYILGTLIKPFVFDKYKIFLTEYQKDVNLRGRV